MGYLKAKDTISGQEGTAYATINGNIHEMFYVKNIEAKVKKNKTEVRTLGKRGIQHKAAGWSGTGSMTIYYVTTTFRRLMYDYMKSGLDTYFDIQIINDDPTSGVGKQTITIKDVNLDSVVMAKLNTKEDTLDENIDFTFEDVQIVSSFSSPSLG